MLPLKGSLISFKCLISFFHLLTDSFITDLGADKCMIQISHKSWLTTSKFLPLFPFYLHTIDQYLNSVSFLFHQDSIILIEKMAGSRGKEPAKRKKRDASPLPTPPTSTSNVPKDKKGATKKPKKGGKHSLPTPPTSGSTVANSPSKRGKKRGTKTKAATKSASSQVAELEDTEMMDVDDEEQEEEEEEELVWDPETSYVGVHLEQYIKEAEQALEPLEPERKLWRKEGSPIHLRTDIPPEWKWHSREPDLSRE